MINLDLLHTARKIRKDLMVSRFYSQASIRDAVELAADNMRQLFDEKKNDSE